MNFTLVTVLLHPPAAASVAAAVEHDPGVSHTRPSTSKWTNMSAAPSLLLSYKLFSDGLQPSSTTSPHVRIKMCGTVSEGNRRRRRAGVKGHRESASELIVTLGAEHHHSSLSPFLPFWESPSSSPLLLSREREGGAGRATSGPTEFDFPTERERETSLSLSLSLLSLSLSLSLLSLSLFSLSLSLSLFFLSLSSLSLSFSFL